MAVDIFEYFEPNEFLLRAQRKYGECCYDCGKYYSSETMHKMSEPMLMKPVLICDKCFTKRNIG